MFKGIYDFDLDEEATVREFRDLPAGIHFPDVLNRIFRHLRTDGAGTGRACKRRFVSRVVGRVLPVTRYFLSSLAGASAAMLAGQVCGHWGTEKQPHW